MKTPDAMKYIVFTACLLLQQGLLIGQQPGSRKLMNAIADQTRVMLQEINTVKGNRKNLVAPRTLEQGELKLVGSRDWTSGFFAGQLWLLYQYSNKAFWKKEADSFTLLLEKEKLNGGTHDMGFKLYPSFGAGYRLTGNAHYREVLIQAARTLITRFNPNTGTLRSWDHNRDKWGFPVIIDNMMNLELLFAATRLSGDSSFYRVAWSHANKTLANHFRADQSSYHVVDYDTVSGKPVKKQTHQGYADESAWARGQAWGLYGFTVCYRETGDPRFLEQAKKIAAFLLGHPRLPADGIPYWDYDDPAIPNAPRDASAAAITASALLELNQYSNSNNEYRKKAGKLLKALSSTYRAAVGTHHGFLLLHSTGHKPHNSEIDVPINYADYYYLEALLRWRQTR